MSCECETDTRRERADAQDVGEELPSRTQERLHRMCRHEEKKKRGGAGGVSCTGRRLAHILRVVAQRRVDGGQLSELLVGRSHFAFNTPLLRRHKRGELDDLRHAKPSSLAAQSELPHAARALESTNAQCNRSRFCCCC